MEGQRGGWKTEGRKKEKEGMEERKQGSQACNIEREIGLDRGGRGRKKLQNNGENGRWKGERKKPREWRRGEKATKPSV